VQASQHVEALKYVFCLPRLTLGLQLSRNWQALKARCRTLFRVPLLWWASLLRLLLGTAPAPTGGGSGSWIPGNCDEAAQWADPAAASASRAFEPQNGGSGSWIPGSRDEAARAEWAPAPVPDLSGPGNCMSSESAVYDYMQDSVLHVGSIAHSGPVLMDTAEDAFAVVGIEAGVFHEQAGLHQAPGGQDGLYNAGFGQDEEGLLCDDAARGRSAEGYAATGEWRHIKAE
jgi:hypothetical protein